MALQRLKQLKSPLVCTALQGKLAMGEALWNRVLAARATATWEQKMFIDSSSNWHRNSQDIQFIGSIIGVTDKELDKLFRLAAKL